MNEYPKIATERFDNATFHIKYCLNFIKKYLKGDILEIGAGCGSFTKNYINDSFNSISLTELDNSNFNYLKKRFKKFKKINLIKKTIDDLEGNFDTILYLHVLEHIKEDIKELRSASHKLKHNGYIIIMAPEHQKMYSNLDKAVGHFRRYEKEFFEKNLVGLKRKKLISVDAIGYSLYFLNKKFFKNEVFPSKLKIFLWDKIFTPITVIIDFFLRYKFGKCIIAIYQKTS